MEYLYSSSVDALGENYYQYIHNYEYSKNVSKGQKKKIKKNKLEPLLENNLPTAVEEELPKYVNLNLSEKDILDQQTIINTKPVNWRQLYRFATKTDMIVVAISVLGAVAGGTGLPLMNVVFGQITGTLRDLSLGTVDRATFPGLLSHFTLYFVYLAAGEFMAIYISTVGFIYTGNKITNAIRQHYMRALFRQNIAFYDKLGAGDVTTRVTSDTVHIQEALSEKVGLTITAFTCFIAVFVIGFFYFWKLTLICASVVVAIVLTMGGGSKFMIQYEGKSLNLYAKGASLAEEVLSSIRIAVAFGLQPILGDRYTAYLDSAFPFGFRAKRVHAFMMGQTFCFIYLCYGLALWMGSRFINSGETDLAEVLTITMSIIIGSMSLGTVAKNSQLFGSGAAAATHIYDTIDRISPLDPLSDEGYKLSQVEGTVQLHSVKHVYPSRPDVVVCENLSLNIPARGTTALVGGSGSGKSTIIGLIQRFYNPVDGMITLDDHDISKLNLKWLRQQIGLVQQEPILFSTTIMENIRFGLKGSQYEFGSEKEIQSRVMLAAKVANAHDFISSFPEGYNTHIGERGFLLSGGQKQRIAIARAIVCDPKILLLDEATSALDSESEAVVQEALDSASHGRTTIVIAHRLSTIKNADNIIVMNQGEVVEQGNHNELLSLGGVYYDLAQKQNIQAENQANRPVSNVSMLTTGSRFQRDSRTYSPLSQNYSPISQSYSPISQSSNPLYEMTEIVGVGSEANLLDELRTHNPVVKQKKAKSKPPKPIQFYSAMELIKFIASFNRPDWVYMLVGFIAAIIAGLGQPIQGILFSWAIATLGLPSDQRNGLVDETNFWSLMFVALGFLQLCSMFIQNTALARCSEKLICRAREHAFRTILNQDIGFFDEKDNEVGALTTFLSTETIHLSGISGATLGTILSALATLSGSMVIGLIFGWKLTLVCLSCLPVLLGCGWGRFKMLAKIQASGQNVYIRSAAYACEHINAIRTVASLTLEEEILQMYSNQLNSHGKAGLIGNLRSSLLFAASESAVFLCMALGFWYGGSLLFRQEYTFTQFFICFAEIIFGAQAAGTVFSFAGDVGKAKIAAERLKILSDRPVKINASEGKGKKFTTTTGRLQFDDVFFAYPTRSQIPSIRDLNITIQPGQFAAFVGASGSGKSTVIQLLQRFYSPTYGTILLDGQDISQLNVNDYRNQIGLVSQEPTLYSGTIRENILLGANDRDVSEEELIKACRDANIYEFILSLPDGFATNVGNKAALLSGGQKQRIAIARALIRQPKILLLDEATSALDSDSEKIVQEALNTAAKGRTTLAVVHRLNTVKDADIIFVLGKGKLLELGTHDELMAMNGRYKYMVEAQKLGELQNN